MRLGASLGKLEDVSLGELVGSVVGNPVRLLGGLAVGIPVGEKVGLSKLFSEGSDDAVDEG
jgi:hypothetical protein